MQAVLFNVLYIFIAASLIVQTFISGQTRLDLTLGNTTLVAEKNELRVRQNTDILVTINGRKFFVMVIDCAWLHECNKCMNHPVMSSTFR